MYKTDWLERLADRLLPGPPSRRKRVPQIAIVQSVQSLESRVLLSASSGTEILVNTTIDDVQRTDTEGGRSVATAPDGSHVVVWSSTTGDGDGWGVFGQRYDSSGTKDGGEFQMNTTTAGDQNNAAVAMRDDGTFVVTWQSFDQDGDRWAVIAQQFFADGTKHGGEILVNVTTSGNQQLPVVTILNGGGFAIGWSGEGPGDALGIFARVFDSSGTPVTGEIAVNETKEFNQVYPSIAPDGTGGFALVWQGNGGPDRKNVMFRHFDGTGVALSSEVVVNETTAGIQKTPSIALTTSGDFVVVWSGRGIGDDLGIFARRLDSTGTPLGGEILVNETTADNQTNPSVVATEDNGFAVAWASVFAVDDGDIYAREFDGSDSPVDGEWLVNSTLDGRHWSPTIAVAGDELVVIWSGAGQGDSFGVFRNGTEKEEPRCRGRHHHRRFHSHHHGRSHSHRHQRSHSHRHRRSHSHHHQRSHSHRHQSHHSDDHRDSHHESRHGRKRWRHGW